MLDDIFNIISTTPGSLAWLPDTTAIGKGALRSSTCRKSEAKSDRFRRRNCTRAMSQRQALYERNGALEGHAAQRR